MDKLRKEIKETRQKIDDGMDVSQETVDKLKALETEKRVYMNFGISCDGLAPYYDVETIAPGTFQMGVCKIKYNHEKGVLEVWLRRPGLIIGKGGQTIDALQEKIGCKIHIHEVRELWDWE